MTVDVRGTTIQISPGDHRLLAMYNWYVLPAGYICTQVKQKTIYLHRLIAKTPEGMDTDHINRDKLDNRRENLRVCDRSTNRRNTDTWAKSGHKFIYKDTSKTWPYKVERDHKTLGRFKTLEEAIKFKENM